MASALTLGVESRQNTGTSSSRKIRNHENKVPGVLYGGTQPAVFFSVQYRHVSKALQDEAFFSQLIDLDIDGKTERVVLRELQRHPASDKVIHIDFMRVSDDRELQISVPIHFLNSENCPGVKLQGGVLSRNLTEIQVSCLPKDIPAHLAVDMTDVEVGTVIHLSDLTLPEGVSIVSLALGEEYDTTVAAVHLPRGTTTDEDEDEESEEEEAARDEENPDSEEAS